MNRIKCQYIYLKTITLIVAVLISMNSFAMPLQHPSGSNLTYGAISNGQSIMSDITNPAAGASILIKEDGQFRFGILSSFGVGYEIGDVADLVNKLDSTIDKFTNAPGSNLQTLDASGDLTTNVNRIVTLVNTDIAKINSLLLNLETNGYFKGFAALHAPLMPFVITHKALSGSFVIDINASAVGLATFLESNIANISGADITNAVQTALLGGQTSFQLNDVINSDSATVVKGAGILEMSLGYSTSIWESDSSRLFLGLRGNYFSVELTRFVQKLDDSSGQSLNDIYKNNKDKNAKDNTGIGIDLGLLWVGENTRAGATLKNINKPSFDYNPIDTSLFTDPAIIAKLQASDKYEMEPQLKLEGALFTENQNWVFGVAVDANAIEDSVGQEFQWATASAAYATDTFLIPGLRIGYRANLAGTELSYLTAGATFGWFNLDIAYSLEEITVEQNDLTTLEGTVPRSIIVNLGLELTF